MFSKPLISVFLSCFFAASAGASCAAQWYEGKWYCSLGSSPMTINVFYGGETECNLRARSSIRNGPNVILSVVQSSDTSFVLRDEAGSTFRLSRVSATTPATFAQGTGTINGVQDPLHCSRNLPDDGISGVLLVGKFRTQQQLGAMTPDNRRNTLIVELANRTKDTVGHYRSLNNAELAGAGSLLVYLRGTGSRTDPQIKTMSADDLRNTVIVEVAAQTHRGQDLQALRNGDLIQLVLGRNSYVRGVLLIGRFRSQRDLDSMSAGDQRNTLITELANRTKSTVGYYQSLRDPELAGAGALLLYLRETGSRTDPQIKTMSADDMRNTVIVEVAAQTGRGRNLQALSNIDLVKLVLER